MTVSINLQRIRHNALDILNKTRVPLIAVVKADAYGLGASQVAEAIGDLVDAFYVFDAGEAMTARLWDIAGKRTIALNSQSIDPQDYLAKHIHPVVWSMESAASLRDAKPVLSIDTGQQRFACPPAAAAKVRDAGACREVMTHAITPLQVDRLLETISGWDKDLVVHAAGTALLDEPLAWLGAVRPGLALYRRSVKVTAPLIEARDSNGPAGYTGFTAARFGVILAGYSNGLRAGPCRLNGQLRRVLEVGMQSAFVEMGQADNVGDEVVLLDDQPGIDESSIARAWGTSQQEVMVRMTKLGERKFLHH